jgi:hypothetical protein
MATMIPSGVEEFTTEGEGRFYKFLEFVCKSDKEYTVWYSPIILDRELDFLLFRRDLGLIIFEVKDWTLDQIVHADPKTFNILKRGKIETNSNPLYQARNYRYKIFDKMRKQNKLISNHPKFRGKFRIPINFGAVFTNINKYEYQEKTELNDFCSVEKLFFGDDLHQASPFCCDTTGECFSNELEKKFPPLFDCSITDHDINDLKALIFHNVKIENPERERIKKYEDRKEHIKVLDNTQESFARQFNGGHRIIKGPSGSGKTIILVHKAAFLLQYEKKIKKILFVCYNLTLANYIKRLFDIKDIPLGKNGIEVHNFYDLCGEIINEPIDHQSHDKEYYKTIIELTLQKIEIEDENIKYDAILVDEGQDFSNDMFKVIIALLNKETDNLTIALDDNQNIYRRTQSWKKLGINAAGKRTQKLNFVYRNTVELTDFFNRFLNNGEDLKEKGESSQLDMFPGFNDLHGEAPSILKSKNMDEIIDFLVEEILNLKITKTVPLSEIAIIYASQYFSSPATPELPSAIMHALDSKGIFYTWVSEDIRAKKSYDITSNRVTLSSIHSVKGLDYSHLFLVGLDYMKPKQWTESQIERLAYVAMTRARDQLYIPFINKNPLIEKLIACL